MAISHICLTCGLDLARTRARLDAALKLPIVTCPECGRHAVRRRHPVVAGWRRGLKTRQAMWTLIGQLALAFLLVFGVSSLSRTFAEVMIEDESTLVSVLRDSFRLESAPGQYDFFMIGPWPASIWLGASIAAGVWLGSAFGHWRRWAIVLLWALWVLLAISVEYIIMVAFAPFAWMAGETDFWRPDHAWWLVTAQVALASLAITLAATLLGVPARRMWIATQRRRWRKRLNRVRQARSGE